MNAKAKKSPQNVVVSAPSQELIPAKRPVGRPSTFNQATADKLCERMAAGETRNQICRDADMPGSGTIRKWMDTNPAFAEQYARAFELLLEHYAGELIDIADDGRNDWMERELRNGKGELVGTITVVDQENIQRSRLRSDNRKWLLSKLLRHKYGEKMDMTLDATVRPGEAVPDSLGTLDPIEATRRYQELMK